MQNRHYCVVKQTLLQRKTMGIVTYW